MEDSISRLSISDTSLDTMRQAVETFRERMCSSNIKFLNDRADEIQEFDLPEEKRVRLLSRFFREKRAQIRGLSSLQEAREQLPMCDELFDVVKPALMNADQCIQYAEAISDIIGDQDIPVPTELATFLQVANGVRDPDFRHDGVSEFLPGLKPAFLYPPEFVATLKRERLKNEMKGRICNPEKIGCLPWNLEVKAAIFAGEGFTFEESWICYYLYCCPRENVSRSLVPPLKSGWGWRVFFYTNMTRIDLLDDFIWDTILDFLDWYGTWIDRLNLEYIHDTFYAEPGEEFDWDDPDF